MSKMAMEEAVKSQQEYWNTYDKQHGYKSYSVETLIDDALYGLGLAIDPSQFQYANGYKKFKEMLIDHLKESK